MSLRCLRSSSLSTPAVRAPQRNAIAARQRFQTLHHRASHNTSLVAFNHHLLRAVVATHSSNLSHKCSRTTSPGAPSPRPSIATAAAPGPRTAYGSSSQPTATTATATGVTTTPHERPSPRTLPRPSPPSSTGRFNWFQQWYAVAALNSLDPTRPNPFTLLGQELVLWRDGSGTWRAFRDACPHRLAPLSEGRVEADGTLLCAYHGWRFGGSGAPTAIPTCKDTQQLSRVAGNPRSCAVAHPTLQRGGVLWVWGEGGPGAEVASAAVQPALPPEVMDDGSGAPGVTCPGWFSRDLPYGHTFFIENVVDPAHVPVSHHKIAGNRYEDPAPFSMELTRPVSLEEGFEIRTRSSFRKDVQEATTSFVPPGHVRITQYERSGARTILALYSTPIRPGWTRHVGQQIWVAAPEGSSSTGVIGLFGPNMPPWLNHVLAAVFLHQDMVFLHHQERIVAQQKLASSTAPSLLVAGEDENTHAAGTPLAAAAGAGGAAVQPPKYFMPTEVDRGVAAWRNWLSAFTENGDVSYAPGTPPLSLTALDTSTLFDTRNTHTKQCAICMKTLRRIRTVRSVAIGVAVVAAGLIVTAIASRVAVAAAAAAAATAVAAAGSAGPIAAGSGSALLPLLAAALGVLGSGSGLLLVAAGLVAAAVVWVTVVLERLMHHYEFSHADNN